MFASFRRSARTARSHSLKVRPLLERLEDRAVPALFGGSHVVNTTDLGTTDASNPTVSANASSSNGMSVVVWTNVHDGQGDVYAQVFDSDGDPMGDEIQVTDSDLFEGDPSVAMDGDGNFVVAWTTVYDNGDKDVMAARYSSDGDLLNSFNVAATRREENGPSVAAADDGKFAIAYTRRDSASGQNVFVRRYDADGNSLGTITVASSKLNELNPSIAFATGGSDRFSVAYQVGYDIDLKRFSAAGRALGTSVLANSKRNESVPSLAMDSHGNHVVAWQEYNGSSWSVRARKVSSTGSLGKVITIKSGSVAGRGIVTGYLITTDYTKPTVAMDRSNGRFAVTYAQNVFGDYDSAGTSESLKVMVTEVNSGRIRRTQTVATLLSSDEDQSSYTNLIYPAISINADSIYTISYAEFGTTDFDSGDTPATIQMRQGQL